MQAYDSLLFHVYMDGLGRLYSRLASVGAVN